MSKHTPILIWLLLLGMAVLAWRSWGTVYMPHGEKAHLLPKYPETEESAD